MSGSGDDDAASYWVSEDGHLRTTAFEIGTTTDRALHIKGASWFGLDGASCYIGGSDRASLHVYAEFLRSNGFNAVRVPLAMSELLPDKSGTCLNPSAYEQHNEAFSRLDYLGQLEKFVRLLGKHGLLVLLDAQTERI